MHPFGFARKKLPDGELGTAFQMSNAALNSYFSTPPIRDFMQVQFLKYIAHIVRRDMDHPTKKALFIESKKRSSLAVWQKVTYLLQIDKNDAIKKMTNRKDFTMVLQARFPYLKKSARQPTKAQT